MHLGIPALESEIAKSAALEGRRTWLIQNLLPFHPPSFIRARTGEYQYSAVRVRIHKKCGMVLSRAFRSLPCSKDRPGWPSPAKGAAIPSRSIEALPCSRNDRRI